MRSWTVRSLVLLAWTAAALPLLQWDRPTQLPLLSSAVDDGVRTDAASRLSHLSEWCASSKRNFMDDLARNKASEWIMVMGNEAGDLDSMVSAIALAYDIAHTKGKPAKAVPLLQVTNDAIDLRPENKLALDMAGMEKGHRDLLTLDDLPFKPSHLWKLGKRIQGIMLVDHNMPLSYWKDTPVLGMVDHHHDKGVNKSADPRVIAQSGSCSSLITSIFFSHHHTHGPVPRSLSDLLLYTIAIDTKGLKKGTELDQRAVETLFPHSQYADQDHWKVMKRLSKELKKAKKDLDGLTLTQLIQRDWKGDVVFDSTVPVHLGFASIPRSLRSMISQTANQTAAAFFEVDNAWAHDNKVDIAILLTNYKDAQGNKQREIIMTVRADHRIDEAEAERLFTDVKREIEEAKELQLTPWNDGQDLGRWRAAWTHSRADGGRKVVRPLVEKAVQHW
ncbi:hypothetical protein EHS25_002098 [Saitozyma podzolica]|uniref:Exopolyphosphatase n=1 Tax=Saitozyma podzolica TaxID=1890683 RepID=A0A427YEY6_9TREE|nr:hypothetical protein EHS25_002098 [Saitozyma podzolica]